MSSRRWFPIALVAMALGLVAAAGGSDRGELAPGRDRTGRSVLDSGFVAVGVQPIGLEPSRAAKRAESIGRQRPPGGTVPLVAFAGAWALLHLWWSFQLKSRTPRACPLVGWTPAPRAPPLPRLS